MATEKVVPDPVMSTADVQNFTSSLRLAVAREPDRTEEESPSNPPNDDDGLFQRMDDLGQELRTDVANLEQLNLEDAEMGAGSPRNKRTLDEAEAPPEAGGIVAWFPEGSELLQMFQHLPPHLQKQLTQTVPKEDWEKTLRDYWADQQGQLPQQQPTQQGQP